MNAAYDTTSWRGALDKRQDDRTRDRGELVGADYLIATALT